MASRKSGYSKMYMIPPSVWEILKTCIDESEIQRIEQLNAEKSLQSMRTRSDEIISNISSQDISPLDKSYRSRSSILETDLSRPIIPQQVSDEFYHSRPDTIDTDLSRPTNPQQISDEFYVDPSLHPSDRSRSIMDPDRTTQTIGFADMTTQTVEPTDMSMTTQTIPLSEASTQILPMETISPYRTSKMKRASTVPSTGPYSIQSKSRKLRSVSMTEPLAMPDRFLLPRNTSRSSLNLSIPNRSGSFGKMNRPDSSMMSRSGQDTSEIVFEPRITSTPIRTLPTIHENPQGPAIIRTLPLASCDTNRSPIKTRTRTGTLAAPVPRNEQFRCPICSKLFAREYNMNKHIATFHKTVGERSGFDKWKI